MLPAADKREKFADGKHHPAFIIGLYLKCSVCVLLLVLLLVIGMQAPETPVDGAQLIAGPIQQRVPDSFHAK